MTKIIPPLILTIIGFTLFLVVSQFIQSEMVFDRSHINNGQWWRIVTGNFTHSNYPHLMLNLSGLWMLGFLFIDSLKTKTFIFSIVILSITIGAGLYFFNPELHWYYGFSGILYGLFLIAAVIAIIEKDYFTGISVALLIISKIIWDFFKGGSTSSAELIGIPIATDAHLYGVIGAVVISSILFFIHQHANKTDNKDTPPPFGRF